MGKTFRNNNHDLPKLKKDSKVKIPKYREVENVEMDFDWKEEYPDDEEDYPRGKNEYDS